MRFEIVERPAFTVIGVELHTSSDRTAEIGSFWQDFYVHDIPGQIPNRTTGQILALYSDYVGDCSQPYILTLGSPVRHAQQVPQGMIARSVPRAKYALFRASGKQPEALIETWKRIRETVLDRAYTTDFDLHSDDPKSSEVEIYVAIE